MKKSNLIVTAKKLVQPTSQAAEEYADKAEILAAEMNKIMLSRSDLTSLIGEGNNNMMEDNHRNHTRFMASVFQNYEPKVIVETVIWVFRAYRSHGFKLTYWPAQLDQWLVLFKNHLSNETYRQIYPFYNWMIIHQADFVLESDQLIPGKDSPSHSS